MSEDEDVPEQYFLLSFQRSLKIPSKGNKNDYGFNCMAQNYNSSQQSNPKKLDQPIDGLYWSVLYSIRFSITGEDSYTNDFSSIDPSLLTEMKTLKSKLDFDHRYDFFENKLHLLNDTLISYNYFLKVYVIQKKFRIYTLSDQEETNRKTQLTLCVSQQFNGMYVVRDYNETGRRKNFTPIYIFVDCPVSHDHYDNYYFSISPKSAFVAHYEKKGKI